MSYDWAFYSMPWDAFERVFGGGDPAVEVKAIQAVTYENLYKSEDEQSVRQLTQSTIRNGIRYSNLNAKQAALFFNETGSSLARTAFRLSHHASDAGENL